MKKKQKQKEKEMKPFQLKYSWVWRIGKGSQRDITCVGNFKCIIPLFFVAAVVVVTVAAVILFAFFTSNSHRGIESSWVMATKWKTACIYNTRDLRDIGKNRIEKEEKKRNGGKWRWIDFDSAFRSLFDSRTEENCSCNNNNSSSGSKQEQKRVAWEEELNSNQQIIEALQRRCIITIVCTWMWMRTVFNYCGHFNALEIQWNCTFLGIFSHIFHLVVFSLPFSPPLESSNLPANSKAAQCTWTSKWTVYCIHNEVSVRDTPFCNCKCVAEVFVANGFFFSFIQPFSIEIHDMQFFCMFMCGAACSEMCTSIEIVCFFYSIAFDSLSSSFFLACALAFVNFVVIKHKSKRFVLVVASPPTVYPCFELVLQLSIYLFRCKLGEKREKTHTERTNELMTISDMCPWCNILWESETTHRTKPNQTKKTKKKTIESHQIMKSKNIHKFVQ